MYPTLKIQPHPQLQKEVVRTTQSSISWKLPISRFHPACTQRLTTMRLLNIRKMELESFANPETAPQYAILSHTWGTAEEEPQVLYEDMSNRELRAQFVKAMEDDDAFASWPKMEKGRKLIGFCKKAMKLGIVYGWVDTCCIDKKVRSSRSADAKFVVMS